MSDDIKYEIRDPVHGFIGLTEWERDIVNHPVFQRLRRIRQLGLTDMVYPGAMHTRFEHSLGVMHLADRMFKEIKKRRGRFLEDELHINPAGEGRNLTFVRIASLLHDVGHSPFSHAGEELMPRKPGTEDRYAHEDYSTAAIRFLMKDVIDGHTHNNHDIKADDIADFIEGGPSLGKKLLWRSLVTGQLDADRADYLLRDSLHTGTSYGRFDLDRICKTLTVTTDSETGSPIIAVEDGGLHAAEGLIVARYMLFTQVYFHYTRRAYDHHITEVMKCLLQEHQEDSELEEKSTFPPPTSDENLKEYMKWNDWKVLGLIDAGKGGPSGEIICNRRHHRYVYETGEYPEQSEFRDLETICNELGDQVAFVDKAEKSWYKIDSDDVQILKSPDKADEDNKPLSELSPVIMGLVRVNQNRVYTTFEDKTEAREKVLRIKNRNNK